MEAICSSETSVGFQRNTRRYIPEDGTLHNHRCENLKSYTGIYTIRYTVMLERLVRRNESEAEINSDEQ
jgi:hypothetical protein